MPITPEEILKKLIEGKRLSEDNKVLATASLVTASRTKELADASMLLAKTTEESAQLLAKTTETSVRQMHLLTIALLVVGFVQTIIAAVAIVISLRLK